MKLSISQFPVSQNDPESNLSHIESVAASAKEAGSELICLPEMCTTGLDWENNYKILDSSADHITTIKRIAQLYSIAICGSFLEKTESGNAANCFCYIDAIGNVLHMYRKIHLFTIFGEDRYAERGNICEAFQTHYGTFGAGICYDLRFPELFRRLAIQGSLLIFIPSAFPHPRLDHWRILVRARAIENQCFIVATNQCGEENHNTHELNTQYFGHSMLVDPWGDILIEGDNSVGMLVGEVNFSLIKKVREEITAMNDLRSDIFHL